MLLCDITVNVNGEDRSLRVDGDRTLLDVLREELGLRAAKYGCGLAQCGACTVLVDDAPARSCVLRVRHAQNRRVTTLEGLPGRPPEALNGGEGLHPVQRAFVEMEGAQCGYCLSGMIMTATAFLEKTPNPSPAETAQALRHNLCRCGTHTEILASVLRAAELMQNGDD